MQMSTSFFPYLRHPLVIPKLALILGTRSCRSIPADCSGG